RDRVARGATGRNAGQLTTYFERPLSDIADEFGWKLAGDARRGFEDGHDLLDLMVGEARAQVRVERFTGRMGMFNRHHLEVHFFPMQGSKRWRTLGGCGQRWPAAHGGRSWGLALHGDSRRRRRSPVRIAALDHPAP